MAEQQIQNKKEAQFEQLKTVAKSTKKWIIIYGFLTIIKFIGGSVSHLVVLFADALGSFLVMLSTTMLYLGICASLKKEDDQFQYGYHRLETFAGLCLSLIIIYGGYKTLIYSYEQLFAPKTTSYLLFAAIGTLVSLCLSYSAYRYDKEMSKKINSVALQASYIDDRNSMITSIGVLLAIVAEYYQIPYVSGGLGMLIATMVILTGIINTKDSILYLLDYWNKPEIQKHIQEILEKSRIVSSVKKMRLRHVGTFIFGEAFLTINPFTDLRDLRSEMHRLEKKIEEDVEHIGDLILYIDPPIPHGAKVAIPVKSPQGLGSIITDDSNEPFYFFLVEVVEGKILNSSCAGKTMKIQEVNHIIDYLKKEKVNILISNMVHPLLYYNLRLNLIKVYPHFTGISDVENTVKLLLLDL